MCHLYRDECSLLRKEFLSEAAQRVPTYATRHDPKFFSSYRYQLKSLMETPQLHPCEACTDFWFNYITSCTGRDILTQPRPPSPLNERTPSPLPSRGVGWGYGVPITFAVNKFFFKIDNFFYTIAIVSQKYQTDISVQPNVFLSTPL